MSAISNLRIAPILATLVLCSCQSTPQTLPPDAQIAIKNEPLFPDYVWHGDGVKEHPTRPQIISQAVPAYPLPLAGRGLRGTAIIGWVIEADGSPSHVQILEASNRYFGDAAKTAVEKWRFTSALFQGKTVAISSTQLFEFYDNVK